MIDIHSIINAIFTSKTYILSQKGSSKAWLVDIGDVEPVFEHINDKGTEGRVHFSSCLGVPLMKYDKFSFELIE